MKCILIVLLTLIFIDSKAQSSEIDIHQIALINPSNKSVGVLPKTRSMECVKIFGKPDNISDYYSEIDEDTMKLYSYGKNKLYFLKDKLVDWYLLDSSIQVGQVGGRIFKVGDKLSPIKGKPLNFQGFIITHYDGESQNMHYKFASVNEIKDGKIYMDSSFFELLFDSKGTLFSISKPNR